MTNFKVLFAMILMSVMATAQGQTNQTDWNGQVSRLPVDFETIDWRRDIYREVNLNKEANAGLSYKDDDNTKNLFEMIFGLVISGKVDAYEFSIDGNEVFSKKHIVDIKDVLDDFRIFYEEDSGKVIIDDIDMPTDEITTYYIKEMMFHDITNMLFRREPYAICPVMVRADEDIKTMKYPMFWVKYEDIYPYLTRVFVYPVNRNMADKMPVIDYFTRNLYEGEIYKAFSLTDKFSNQQDISENDGDSEDNGNLKLELKRLKQHSYNTFNKVQESGR